MTAFSISEEEEVVSFPFATTVEVVVERSLRALADEERLASSIFSEALVELEDDRFNPTMVPEFEPVACCAAGLVVYFDFFFFLETIIRKLGN